MYRARTGHALMGPRAPQTIHPVSAPLSAKAEKKQLEKKTRVAWNNATRLLYFDQTQVM